MKKIILMTWVVIISAFVFIIFQTSYMIDKQERRLNELHSEIRKMESDIAVLESEWSYLSRPERITKLVEQHLQVNVPYSAQLASFSHLTEWLENSPVADEQTAAIQASFNE